VFVDLCFLTDIILNFRTTIVDKKTGFEVVQPKKIAWAYIKSGWFIIDLVASIPFEWLYSLGQPTGDDSSAETQANL